MPIYEYGCRDCETEFEQFLLSAGESIACPSCESTKVERRLSVFRSPGGEKETAGGGCGCTPSTCGCH